MRQTIVDVKWFAACTTFDEVRALYKVLVMQHHPDKGGSLQTMQEINVEYDMLKKDPSRLKTRQHTSTKSYGGDWWTRHNEKVHDYRTYTAEDFKIKPGRYVCEIKKIQENAEKQYVALVFDIAEGKYKGHFGFDPWYRRCIYLSYKTDWQIRNTKKFIDVINASNPGFDGHDAFCNDKTYLFIGKKLIIELTQQYIDGDGFINPGQVHVYG